MIKKTLKIFSIIIVILLMLSIILIGTIDETPINDKDLYREMMTRLDTLSIPYQPAQKKIQCGWSVVNLMPGFKTPMAGYAPKDPYEDVHDSLFVRTMVLDNGNSTIALVSFDLLITPPLLADRLEQFIQKESRQIDHIYFSATHTHNGIGGWDDSFGGQLITGDFDEDILNHIYNTSVKSIKQASSHMEFADLSYIESDASKYARNRLDQSSAIDGKIRGLELTTNQNEKLLLFTFSAHATNIPRKSKSISNDYPGQLINDLQTEYKFIQFMSGAVGSHSIDNVPGEGFEKIDNAGKLLSEVVLNHQNSDIDDSLSIGYMNLEVLLDKSQMRISDNLKVRDWVFSSIFNPLDAQIRILKIGNILMLGMPCDFSGELLVDDKLYELAENNGIHLIVTSFNGDYIGYITEDSHYHQSHRSEVMTMNWVGPHHGAYFSEIVKQIILKASKK